MLTVLHPEVLPLIKQIPGGLIPIQLGPDEPFSLVVKTQKEAIVAARMNGGFAFYIPVLPSSTVPTISLISAFFDDDDEPLTIRSPLFANDSFSKGILEVLGYDEVDIYFFDEQNYEWMSFTTSLVDFGSCLINQEEFYLLYYHPETFKSIEQALANWFSNRTADDDSNAIQAVFNKRLAPSEIVVFDMMPNCQGSLGFKHDMLTRTNPGYFQERDIFACLLRVFTAEKVLMNPRRKDTHKEILDHLVLTDSLAILIQAKDSPTTEISIRRSIERKRQTARKQIDDAIRQIIGAARYLSREPVVRLVVDGNDVEVSIGKRKVIGIAIVKELFADESNAYTSACSELYGLSGRGIVVDYNSFHAFTHHFNSETEFTTAMDEVITLTVADGWFPVNKIVSDSILRKLESTTEQED